MTTVKTCISITEDTTGTLKRVNEILKVNGRKILTLSEAARFGVEIIGKIPEEELCEQVRSYRIEKMKV
ncbi:hypothetical protein [Vibrio sonorensis]|uniref:hypothetical protein n=1 Tax=Vibrio sonorensis TaxID=1004316 RepID=UPI0008DA5020|nr:hypothetical protein [Vibrio sonorensis]